MKFVVDIDDTLLYSSFSMLLKKYIINSANKKLIKKINKLYNNGHEIILWTGRHWNDLLLTKGQLACCGIKYTTLIMGKPVADYYIDDKAITPDKFLELDI